MTAPAVDLLVHDLAVITAIGAADVLVELAKAPEGALEALRNGDGPDYVVVYPLHSLRLAAAANDSEGDLDAVYQTTIVAASAEGARHLVAVVETAVKTVTIAGRDVVRVTCDETGDVRPDDDVDPPVFYATPRWRIWTTTPA